MTEGISQYPASSCRSSFICSVNRNGNTVKLLIFAQLYQILCWFHVIKVTLLLAKRDGNLFYLKVDSTTLTFIELGSSFCLCRLFPSCTSSAEAKLPWEVGRGREG